MKINYYEVRGVEGSASEEKIGERFRKLVRENHPDRYKGPDKASAERKARDRVNQRVDQTIDGAMNKTEETVKCVATDQECLNKAKNEGKPVTVVNTASASDSMKCLATDVNCLKQAKAQGKKVEIVDEAQLDTLRCAVTDADCLGRAKSMGKKVEIID